MTEQMPGELITSTPSSRPRPTSYGVPALAAHPVPGLQQDRDLLVPGPAAERVAVDQHDGLAGAVILVVDLDADAVLLADSY